MTDPTARTIVILGATSGIGAAATDVALKRGHRVRGFARSAAEMEPRDGLTPVPGDATDPCDVARALDGAEGVIFALGINERLSMLWQKETLFSQATGALIPEMEKAGVKRLIAVTGFGAGRSRAAQSRIEQIGHRAVLGRVYDDKDRQEELIVASNLDWTIVRPTILTKGARTGRATILRDSSTWKNGLIARKEVADCLIDIWENASDIRADVVITRA